MKHSLLPLIACLACWSTSAVARAPLSDQQASELAGYVAAHADTPEQYVVNKLARYDVVFLAEDHAIKHNLLLVQRLVPLLYQAGVYTLGMEFGASEDQSELDELVTAKRYDATRARRLMFNYNVGWPYREYMDIYRAAWNLNRSLPPGARKFRVLNLSYQYDWSAYAGNRTPEVFARVHFRGNPEVYRAEVVRREILAKGEKILILAGNSHAFTRYAQPVDDYLSVGFYRLETRYMGGLLYQQVPTKVFTIQLHRAFDSQTGGGAELLHPADGAVEQVMSRLPGRRVGFDLVDTPLGELRDHSYYAIGHPDLRLGDLADGYIYERPLSEFESCTVDPGFVTAANWQETRRRYPDFPPLDPWPATPREYLHKLEEAGDVAKRYRLLIKSFASEEELTSHP